jgi:hypothetical protein
VDGRGTSASRRPGIRFVFCEKLDSVVGAAFAFADLRLAEEMICFDFRWRF